MDNNNKSLIHSELILCQSYKQYFHVEDISSSYRHPVRQLMLPGLNYETGDEPEQKYPTYFFFIFKTKSQTKIKKCVEFIY